uniref:Uncharacterized protein n=1 Tax=Setaria viridis TaxID=4556 RepID=A0A4U6VI70_SETVI|nr:hypothetical protein SEVIR_3G017050v2 [Setaria viridis]
MFRTLQIPITHSFSASQHQSTLLDWSVWPLLHCLGNLKWCSRLLELEARVRH